MIPQNCPKCKKLVQPKKDIEPGPLFDTYQIKCSECGEILDEHIEEDRTEFEDLNPSDLPPTKQV
jgi:endogenous inhibitor of DNA gyrase (YacG/DUF329 family)